MCGSAQTLRGDVHHSACCCEAASREPLRSIPLVVSHVATSLKDSMNTAGTLTVRKLRMHDPITVDPSEGRMADELDLRSRAQVQFTSEHGEHPIDNLFDGSGGAGASRWVGGRQDRPETILLVFDEPMNIARCEFEAEERQIARTQQVTVECLLAGASVYRQCFIQEFNFTPQGATYQRERIDLNLQGVCRLRFTILADKSGRGVPSLTALRLFAG
jgi:hypothetical protein